MLYTFVKKNCRGTDYICADIHGCFPILESQLHNMGFNKAHDRLFCLGDMIDRGTESHLCLHYLDQPWFFSILGNHEKMLLDAVNDELGFIRKDWTCFGGGWTESLSAQELGRYSCRFLTLPVALELELPSGKHVGLVHAELPDNCDWQELRKTLQSQNFSKLHPPILIKQLLWQRRQIYYSKEKKNTLPAVAGIDHIFHGHTVVRQITTIGNRTFMDLGSHGTGVVGMLNPEEYLK